MEETYIHLIRKKKKFLLYTLTFSLVFYFLLPIALTFLPEMMYKDSFIPGLTWAWLYAFMQIIMIWLLGILYHQMAKKMERLLERSREE